MTDIVDSKRRSAMMARIRGRDTTPELTIAVLPGYRGRGIGTALLERLIAAVEIEYEALSLSVWPANPAYRLYLRMGFEVVEENGPAVTMVKILRGS